LAFRRPLRLDFVGVYLIVLMAGPSGHTSDGELSFSDEDEALAEPAAALR